MFIKGIRRTFICECCVADATVFVVGALRGSHRADAAASMLRTKARPLASLAPRATGGLR